MQPKLLAVCRGESDLLAWDVHPRSPGQTWDAGPKCQCPQASHHGRLALNPQVVLGFQAQRAPAVLMQGAEAGAETSVSKP